MNGQLIWQQVGRTDAATRTVALGDQTLAVLLEHRPEQHDHRQLAGLARVDDLHGPLVFTDPLGRPLRPDSSSRTFVRVTREVGAPPLDVHAAALVAAAIDELDQVVAVIATARVPSLGCARSDR